MIRTKYSKHLNIPDAINCSKKENFTQIPNDLLRNPKISGKAKAIICLLLSNSDNWHSYFEGIRTMMKEEEHAIRSGLKELENFGYLKRIRYRDKITKKLKGSFWAYCNVPFSFEYQKQIDVINSHNLEIVQLHPQAENSNVEKTTRGFPPRGKTSTKNTNIKEKQISFSKEKEDTVPPFLKEDKNKEYFPLAEQLSKIITSHKNIRILPSKIKAWANDIRKLIETDGVSYKRVRTALNWYAKNIGGRYIPVIESGSSLHEKFIKLENAMNNDGYKDSSYTPKNNNSSGTRRFGIKSEYRKADKSY